MRDDPRSAGHLPLPTSHLPPPTALATRSTAAVKLFFLRCNKVCRVGKRSWLNLAFAALLLVAQHGALTHSVWHLGRNLPVQAHVEPDGGRHVPAQDDRSPQSRLCDLHFAMGSTLGGHCAAQATPVMATVSPWLATPDAAWRVAQPLRTPPSRAPPVLL